MDGAGVRTRGMTWIAIVVVVAVLYAAQEVLIPFALALLLSFLLAPVVGFLRRCHLGPVPSAVITVTLAMGIILGLGTFVSYQVLDIAKKLPQYRQTIVTKLRSFKPGDGALTQAFNLVRDTEKEIASQDPANTVNPPPANATDPAKAPDPKPVPVEIKEPAPKPLRIVQRLLGTVLSPVVTAGIVAVFVLFMLIYQEDLRDRLVRLIGMGRLNVTTQALNDAAARVSRYLLMQLVVNVTYGIPAGIGLYFIGVPNALLWGVLACLLRFIPYLGPTLGAALPLTLAFAVDPGWSMLLWAGGLFLTMELISNNLVEPLLYGSSTGLSPVAVILSAVFWTWLWGPVGLFLATPLTVCLVSFGRHFPQMGVFNILFGDEPVLTPEAQLYQRLLARTPEEAIDLADNYLEEKPVVEFCQAALLPALSLAEGDRHSGLLTEAQQSTIASNVRELMADLDERAEEEADRRREDHETAREVPAHQPVILIPARPGTDELVCQVLGQLLAKRGLDVRPLSANALTAEWIQELRACEGQVACLATIVPTGFRHVQYRYKRLQHYCPNMRLVLYTPGTGLQQGQDNAGQAFSTRPTDLLTGSLTEVLDQLTAMALTAHPQEKASPSPEPHMAAVEH